MLVHPLEVGEIYYGKAKLEAVNVLVEAQGWQQALVSCSAGL